MPSAAFEPFILPNGTKLKNRIIKAAMEENFADVEKYNQPSQGMIKLYRRWAEGGAALQISGHVMIDPTAMGSSANLLLSEDTFSLQEESVWRDFIAVSKLNNTRALLQINHPGRQIRKGANLPVYGPSPIAVNMGSISKHIFDLPIEMDENRIQDIISRFAWASQKAEELGADGVEIHAAHGYLISSFLSPRSNQRQDRWGGNLENRSRLLFEVIRAIRKATSKTFILGVKINTADFQRGGFSADDLLWVVENLKPFNLDFLELSGGSYESPSMMGAKKRDPAHKPEAKKASTLAREAYFLEAAKAIQGTASMPLMITGGVRNIATVDAIVSSSPTALVGTATAIGIRTDLPNAWSRGEDVEITMPQSWVLPGALKYAASTAIVQSNLQRIGAGKSVWPGLWPLLAVIIQLLAERRNLGAYKSWIYPWIEARKAEKKLA